MRWKVSGFMYDVDPMLKFSFNKRFIYCNNSEDWVDKGVYLPEKELENVIHLGFQQYFLLINIIFSEHKKVYLHWSWHHEKSLLKTFSNKFQVKLFLL